MNTIQSKKFGEIEKYTTSRYKQKNREPIITISKNGVFYLSCKFVLEYDVKNYCELHYSRLQRAIIIKFSDEKIEHSSLKVCKFRKSSTIAAISFLKNFDLLKYKASFRYLPISETVIEIGEVFVIYLDEMIVNK